jgi:hypothetical protein
LPQRTIGRERNPQHSIDKRADRKRGLTRIHSQTNLPSIGKSLEVIAQDTQRLFEKRLVHLVHLALVSTLGM